jgi:hypothetical protein
MSPVQPAAAGRTAPPPPLHLTPSAATAAAGGSGLAAVPESDGKAGAARYAAAAATAITSLLSVSASASAAPASAATSAAPTSRAAGSAGGGGAACGRPQQRAPCLPPHFQPLQPAAVGARRPTRRIGSSSGCGGGGGGSCGHSTPTAAGSPHDSPTLAPRRDTAPPPGTVGGGGVGSRHGSAQHGVIVGTLPYLAPEVLIHGARAYGAAVDWWALGVLAFEMAHGVRPFDGCDRLRTIKAITSAEPRPPSAPPPSTLPLAARVSRRARSGGAGVGGGVGGGFIAAHDGGSAGAGTWHGGFNGGASGSGGIGGHAHHHANLSDELRRFINALLAKDPRKRLGSRPPDSPIYAEPPTPTAARAEGGADAPAEPEATRGPLPPAPPSPRWQVPCTDGVIPSDGAAVRAHPFFANVRWALLRHARPPYVPSAARLGGAEEQQRAASLGGVRPDEEQQRAASLGGVRPDEPAHANGAPPGRAAADRCRGSGGDGGGDDGVLALQRYADTTAAGCREPAVPRLQPQAAASDPRAIPLAQQTAASAARPCEARASAAGADAGGERTPAAPSCESPMRPSPCLSSAPSPAACAPPPVACTPPPAARASRPAAERSILAVPTAGGWAGGACARGADEALGRSGWARADGGWPLGGGRCDASSSISIQGLGGSGNNADGGARGVGGGEQGLSASLSLGNLRSHTALYSNSDTERSSVPPQVVRPEPAEVRAHTHNAHTHTERFGRPRHAKPALTSPYAHTPTRAVLAARPLPPPAGERRPSRRAALHLRLCAQPDGQQLALRGRSRPPLWSRPTAARAAGCASDGSCGRGLGESGGGRAGARRLACGLDPRRAGAGADTAPQGAAAERSRRAAARGRRSGARGAPPRLQLRLPGLGAASARAPGGGGMRP